MLHFLCLLKNNSIKSQNIKLMKTRLNALFPYLLACEWSEHASEITVYLRAVPT